MKDVKIGELLESCGLDLTKKIKLVRHAKRSKEILLDGKKELHSIYDLYKYHKEKFISYQSSQHRKIILDDVDYIVSFIGGEGTTAIFLGVYRVEGYDKERINKFRDGYFYYRTSEVLNNKYDELKGKLTIDWGNSTICWAQWLHNKGKDMKVLKGVPESILQKL